jgi:hypothetical protein
MPLVSRKMTQATGLISRPIVAAEEDRLLHRHTFELAPDELQERPLELRVERVATGTQIELTNRLPHNLPTGDFGVRVVQVDAVGINATGEQISLGQWELTNSGDTALRAGESRRWQVAAPQTVERVAVTVSRHGRDDSNRRVLFVAEVAVP